MPKGDNPGNTTDPYGNPTGAFAPPGSVPRANVPSSFYNASGPYTGPTYAYTPQSGYTSLADQLSKAFSLSPTSLATPRTSLLPMYATPWAALYGGPSDPTFAQLWGQDPSLGTPTSSQLPPRSRRKPARTSSITSAAPVSSHSARAARAKSALGSS